MTRPHETFLTGTNARFIAELYARYLESPAAVDPSWVAFFSGLEDDARAMIAEMRGASWTPAAPSPSSSAYLSCAES